MIIITGSATAHPDMFDELLAISQAHVRRSRAEPGCLSHAVYIDSEDPLRLFFFETWVDRDAVAAHFAVPASGEFVREAARLAAVAPAIQIYDATVRG